jgi:hypothetical protein
MRRRTLTTVIAGALACGLLGGMTMGIASAAQSSTVHYKVVQKAFSVNPGDTDLVTVNCPRGLSPVGGGGHYGDGEFPDAYAQFTGISESDVSFSGRGWTVTAWVSSGVSKSWFTANVVCAAW